MRIALTTWIYPALGAGRVGAERRGQQRRPAAAAAPAIAPVQPANPLQPVSRRAGSLGASRRSCQPDDVALYRQIFAAERNGEISKAKKLLAKISDPIA